MDAAKDIWWKALISLACGSGLKRNEILNLTWSDIDFEKQIIHIRAKAETAQTIEWEPKDHENRVVPICDQSARMLVDMQAEAQEKHPYVFISPARLQKIRERQKQGKWTARSHIVNNMRNNFLAMRDKAGMTKLALHDLRRSALTNWAQRLPMQVVQQLAAHSDISTTKKYYFAVRLEDLQSAGKVLNNIMSWCSDD